MIRVDVVAVETQSRFESQRIACSESDGFYPQRLSRFHECIPERDGAIGFDEQLEAVFPRVTGARDRDADARDFGEPPMKGEERSEICLARPSNELHGGWPLHGDEPPVA